MIAHPELPPDGIEGFTSFWARYVTGFNSETHCQKCFKGPTSDLVRKDMATGVWHEMHERASFSYLYVCGVARSPRAELYRKNFHLALRPDEGSSVSAATYNGYIVHVANAVSVAIPPLPEGWNGLVPEMYRCKNFQFGVEYFGYPAKD
jgi:hypothetical protein